MLTSELLNNSSSLRYAIRDKLKTRYTDIELLMHLNQAIRKVARDTRYFRGFSTIQVTAYKQDYKLDYRILRVLSVYTEGCELNIRSATETCERTSENTIDFVTVGSDTRTLSVVPILTNPLYEPTDYDKIVVENDLDSIDNIGIPLYIDEDGNVSPIIGLSADYKEVVLFTEYFPVLELSKEVPDIVLDLEELINIAVVEKVTAHSTINETRGIHREAQDNYIRMLREFKKLSNNKHVQAEHNMVYRSPFQGVTKSKRRDF